MKREDKLYDALGELLYVVAMADGVIQPEEKDALEQFLNNHSYEGEIKWSFKYEEGKKSPIDEVYRKVLDYCHNYGPSPIYVEFIDAMKTIAAAVGGIDENESKYINSFSSDLLERFQKDADRLLALKEEEEEN